MEAFIEWVRGTSLSQAINLSTWVWPFAETIHFIGLTLVLGIVGFFDLRLMGFFKRIPISAARELMPFAILGFGMNLVTGLIFLTGLPEQYAHNRIWWFKVGFLALAGLNAVLYESRFSSKILQLGADEETPAMAKLVGVVSLLSWLGVLYCGRMLPFLGDAF